MRNALKQLFCVMMTVALVITCAPIGVVWAETKASEYEVTGAADDSAAPASIPNMEEGEDKDKEEKTKDEEDGERTVPIENENNDIVPETGAEEDNAVEAPMRLMMLNSAAEGSVVADPELDLSSPDYNPGGKHGKLVLEAGEQGYSGTATPADGYDLATIRQIWTEGDTEKEQYLDYTYNSSDNTYSFEVQSKEYDSVVTAYFFSLEVWDGAVDLTWYDPDDTVFEIGTPAEFAGLAAITNGMVDDTQTFEYMIKDNEGRSYSEEDGIYKHEYISTEPHTVDLLTPDSGSDASQVRDTAWRLPEVEHQKVGGASDDIHNDFLYRTVRLTADLDMTGANWTPIGGKYAMHKEADSKNGIDPMVIDTRFQGVFDGQGHTVKINCDRQAKMGFPYAMEIGLIGYLGGGVDYDNGYPKDCCMHYKNYWVPTVRNVVVEGIVKGRRMVGGVVGRTGETNYGVLVENCVNRADVEASDMRGCAGIVGAAWGKATIRNCYNAGTIHSVFWEHGGIVGSNGYVGSEGEAPGGANIYNCYNRGAVAIRDSASSSWKYDGHEIGADGGGFSSYTVANCFYEEPQQILTETGYTTGNYGANKKAKIREVEAANLKDSSTIDRLNGNGEVYFADSAAVNDGYPVLYFETAEYKANPESFRNSNITLDNSNTDDGQISAEGNLTNLPYGKIVNLSYTAEKGKRFKHYLVTEAGQSQGTEISLGDFYVASGRNVTIKAVFGEQEDSTISFAEEDDGDLYYVIVRKVAYYDYEEKTHKTCDEPVKAGDSLEYMDRIKIQGVMKPWEGKKPDNERFEYSGKLGDLQFTENSLTKVDNTNNTYEVTGEIPIIELAYEAKTQGKRWTTLADTSWYKAGTKTFVINTTKQLAGVAKLCNNGTDFKGVTIKLGKDISLANVPETGGDVYERSWVGIGKTHYPFRGTFDGQGYTVSHMFRNFAKGYCDDAGYGGLFGVTEGAVIKNVNVDSSPYTTSAGVEIDCGFINGAYGGAIVGSAADTKIENCNTDLDMNSARQAGGIAGEIEGRTFISNCVNNGTILGTDEKIGGIAAFVRQSDNLNGIPEIKGCVNKGEIKSSKWKVGGILGSGESYAVKISKCINEAPITTEMKGTFSNANAVGGIFGYSSGNLNCSESINKGDITGKIVTYSQGGIRGTLLKGTISNCYNSGNIHSESTSAYAMVSGIVNLGTNKANIATVSNCYNTGRVSVSDGFKTDKTGGAIAVGNTTSNIVKGVYCTDESVAEIDGKAGAMGDVVSAADLKGYGNKLGDFFVRDLNAVNNGYPVLIWQIKDFVGKVTMNAIKKNSDTVLTASWKRTGASSGVELYRSLKKDSGYSRIYTGAASNYKNSKLTYGKTYYYKARIYRTVDGKKYYGGWSAVKSYKLIPAAPKIKTIKNSKSKQATLTWSKVNGATGYEIYRSLKKGSGYKKIATIKKGKTVKYVNKKLKKGKTYYYKIRTYKTVNKKKGYSAYSAVKSIKIKK